jgi:hypothetical protein
LNYLNSLGQVWLTEFQVILQSHSDPPLNKWNDIAFEFLNLSIICKLVQQLSEKIDWFNDIIAFTTFFL